MRAPTSSLEVGTLHFASACCETEELYSILGLETLLMHLMRWCGAGSEPAAVNAANNRTISAATAVLAFHHKWLSAREKFIENGSLQLEISRLCDMVDWQYRSETF